MQETRVFFASLDAFVIAVSTLIVSILSAIIAFSIRWMAVTPAQWLLPSCIIVVCSAILIGGFLFAPTKFLLETDAVVVRRPVGDVRLAFSEISQVGTDDRWYGLSAKALPGGNSGLFGVYGRFHDRLLGHFRMYGTKAHGSVVLAMKHDETVVLTPNEREEFATELKRLLNNLQNN
jgi:hypothetical protein